jgi:hypothetical protein
VWDDGGGRRHDRKWADEELASMDASKRKRERKGDARGEAVQTICVLAPFRALFKHSYL